MKKLLKIGIFTGLLIHSFNAHAAFMHYKSIRNLVVSESSVNTPTSPTVVNDTITLSDYNGSYLPFGTINRAYNFDMKVLASVIGATAVNELKWSVIGGALPHGLALATTGEITGVPDTAGANSVYVAATSANSAAQKIYYLSIKSQPTLQAKVLASKFSHTCAVAVDNSLFCWGVNGYGQVGDNTTTQKQNPTLVSTSAKDFTAVAAGGSHTCGISKAYGTLCWGSNTYGQLGRGSTGGSVLKPPVIGVAVPSDTIGLSAGGLHTCALSKSEGVKCWGYNGTGQLGNGTYVNSATPVAVQGLPTTIKQLVSGESFNCALTDTNAVFCWGINDLGQLGNGSVANSVVPVQVSNLASDISTITAGTHHACALSPSQGLKCWGNNAEGQLGDGTQTSRRSPVAVVGLPTDITIVSAGVSNTCANSASQGLKCWGYNNYGQLADGTNTTRTTPQTVINASSDILAMSAGQHFECYSSAANGVMCWGRNNYGQLGIGNVANYPQPISTVMP